MTPEPTWSEAAEAVARLLRRPPDLLPVDPRLSPEERRR